VRVVPPFYVAEERESGFGVRGKVMSREALDFECGEQAPDHSDRTHKGGDDLNASHPNGRPLRKATNGYELAQRGGDGVRLLRRSGVRPRENGAPLVQ
jgi:hypothetical protein